MNQSIIITLITAGIGFGTPLLLAGLGQTLTQRSGVLDLSVDGTMLVGAFSAYWTAAETGSLALALPVAILAGTAMSLILVLFAVTLRVNQVIVGLGLLILGTGLSEYLGSLGDNPLTGRLSTVTIEPYTTQGLADLPIVGPVLFGHDFLVYTSWLLAAAVWYYLFRSRAGVEMRAVGYNPAAAEAAGISVTTVRYLHTLVGGAFAGLGGAYFSLAVVPAWKPGMTSGAGWIAIALVLVSRWDPLRLFVFAIVFGAATRLGLTLQLEGIQIAPQLLSMLPWILAGMGVVYNAKSQHGSDDAPAALGAAFFREER